MSMSQKTPFRPVTAETTEAFTVLKLSSTRMKSFILVSRASISLRAISMQSAMIVAPVIQTLAADSWKVSDWLLIRATAELVILSMARSAMLRCIVMST